MTNRTKTQFLTSTAIAMVFTNLQISPAYANPEGGTIKSGEAVITTPDTKTLEINQNSQNVIIDWKRFDIKAGETTRFVQPNSEAWALNRVVGSTDPSHIHGSLEANGNVIIVNPDGIHFGSESRVDVNRLIATTHDISNNNFMAGKYVFDLPGNPSASIVNEGDISIADYGLSAFVAPSVRNSGTITAKFGQINLASGNQFTIDPYGDGLIKLAIDDEITSKIYDVATGKQVSDLVKNEGVLKADGGIVALSATTARQVVNSVVNNTGIIEANSIGTKNGKIILGAQTSKTKIKTAQRQKVKVSGKINSTAYPIPSRITVPTPNPRRGGRIEIMGEEIEMASALLDVSGVNGGGTVLIGGDYKGGNGDAETIARYRIELENQEYSSATWLSADEQTLIKANALSLGNGGKVILWSDETTNTAADIFARGGSTSGNGGFIETSGKQDLISTGFVNAGAVNGLAGTWLLDPTNVTVDTNDVSLTLNNGTSVDITASNRIDINGSISKTSGGNAKLDLRAGNYIAVNLGAVSTSGELDIFMSAPTIDGRFDKVNTNGGDVTLELNQVDYSLGFNNFKTEGGDLSVSSSHNLWLDSLNVNTGGGDIDMSSNSHIIARSTNIELGGGTAKFSAEEVGFCRPACSNISADPNFEYDQSAYRNLTGTSISNPFGGLIKNGILKVIIDGVDPAPVTPPTPIDNKPTVGSNTINQITYENGNTGLNQSNISNLFSDDGGTQNLTITFMGVPTGVTATANADGSVSFTSNSGVDLPIGNHSITISAKDNSGQSVSRSISLIINKNNQTTILLEVKTNENLIENTEPESINNHSLSQVQDTRKLKQTVKDFLFKELPVISANSIETTLQVTKPKLIFDLLFKNIRTTATDVERLSILEEVLKEPNIADEIYDVIKDDLFAELGKEISLELFRTLLISLLSDGISEIMRYQGLHTEAFLFEELLAPIELVLLDAYTLPAGTTPYGLVVANFVIWSENLYKFTALGLQLSKDRLNGNSYNDRLWQIQSLRMRYSNSLLTGELYGVQLNNIQKSAIVDLLSQLRIEEYDLTIASTRFQTIQRWASYWGEVTDPFLSDWHF